MSLFNFILTLFSLSTEIQSVLMLTDKEAVWPANFGKITLLLWQRYYGWHNQIVMVGIESNLSAKDDGTRQD